MKDRSKQTEKQKILFVDDENNVLQGLKRMLRSLKNEWDMQFVESAQKALDILEKEPIDVIITDIRMPQMDGIKLLTKIQKDYPSVVRIILSGHSDQNLLMQATKVSHQFLAKPCSAETLKQTVSRLYSLQPLLSDPFLRQIVAKTESLPSLPELYNEIVRIMNSPNPSMTDAGKVIAKDVGMSAKILQLVNSAFFGIRTHIASPEQAVLFLGIDIIKSLVLSIQIFTEFNPKLIPKAFIKNLWQHSMLTGLMAKAIAKLYFNAQAAIDNAFMAGQLHDVGKIVFSTNFPQEYHPLIMDKSVDQQIFVENERRQFNISHTEIGAYLMGLWGLPFSVVEAILYHHNPNLCSKFDKSPLTAVYIANIFAHHFSNNTNEPLSIENFDVDYLIRLNIADQIPDWQLMCQQIFQQTMRTSNENN